MKIKRLNLSITFIAFFIGTLLFAVTSQAQPAMGANKFVGNITTYGQVRSDFLTYWNQITPENESKWGSVEGTRNVMNWSGVDRVKNFAEKNNITWKFHTLIWGGQCPGWISGLSQADQLAEVTQWFDLASQRYPNVNMIDVVNEAYEANGGRHAPAPFREALGGSGTTGFDYIIKAFKMARQRWPHAILIYNDYNTIEYNNEVNWMVKLATVMKQNNVPMDAIGCQAHDAWRIPTATVKANLDKLAAIGYPIFITEYDIGESDDTKQKNIMQEQFTMFWNHPKIVGITYWGYVVGATWRSGTGLLNSNGTERPALTWLKDYVKNNPNPPNDFPNLIKTGGGITSLVSKGSSVAPVTHNTICPKLVSNPQLGVILVSKSQGEKFNLNGKMIRGNVLHVK
jgi:endo-1,4-beta-xylanase